MERNNYIKMKTIRNLLIIAIAVITAACGGKTGGKPTLMVSIPPQKFVLERIAGDKWDVECMLEKATSAESYDPEMSQMMKLERCRAYFLIGNLGFERLVADKLSDDRSKTLVNSAEGITTIGSHSHHGESEADPHVWMSVENMRSVARNMAAALTEIDEANKAFYQANLQRFDSEMKALGDSLRHQLVSARGRAFVVWHPALTYFARDYGLHQISIEYEGKEAPMSFVAEKVAEAVGHHATVFFMQKGLDSRQASSISDRIGLRRVEINPLSYDWISEMKHIADEIARQ